MSLAFTSDSNDLAKRYFVTLRAYRPLVIGLLISVALAAGISFMKSGRHAVTGQQSMNLFMGAFLVVFALPKLYNLAAFVDTFRKYDIITKRLHSYAYAYPFIELLLGVIFVSGVAEASTISNYFSNGGVAIITGATLIGVIDALRRKQSLDCACMGSAFKFPLSRVAIVENGAMFLMSVSMIVMYGSSHMPMVATSLRVLS